MDSPSRVCGRCGKTYKGNECCPYIKDPQNYKPYNKKSWRRISKRFLNSHPICMDCGYRLATDVHHIEKHAGDINKLLVTDEKLMALCKTCHAIRTGKGE